MKSYQLAPIILFVYKRPEHTRSTLQALAKNSLADESVLYIYADGVKDENDTTSVKKIQEVRDVLKEKQWCKEVHIIEASENKGLANSVIEGVTDIVNKHGKVIVLEDDLLISRGFLKYMNDGLDKYSSNEQVMQISGYQFPIEIPAKGKSFFMSVVSSWGWATWKRAWQHFDPLASGYEKIKTDVELAKRFDLNGSYPYSTMLLNQMEKTNIDSWAIRWWWTVFKNKGLSLFPDSSLVKNIGYGKDASHTKGYDPFEDISYQSGYYINSFPENIKIDMANTSRLQELLRKNEPSKLRKAIALMRKYIGELNLTA